MRAGQYVEQPGGFRAFVPVPLPPDPPLNRDAQALNPVNVDWPDVEHLDDTARNRLLGRYAADAPAIVEAAEPADLEIIPGTQTLIAELPWVARNEGVVHLEDLLLRRVRIGLLLPQGGAALLPKSLLIPDLLQRE